LIPSRNNNNNNDKPTYIVLHNKNYKTCLLIDIAILDDSNFKRKETEKPSKFKDLEIEIGRMWRVRTKFVPVAIGTLGTIHR